ncbi:hypothetical protein XENOCAPTIV_014752 [Xenoophorus captivus]|uniref:Protein MIS12 homolog n=1 Tax=Xenoophorus captivus TaxID=1517983 RepID=A0ABV0QDD6_9TELE
METVGTEEEEKDRFSSSSLKLYEAQFFSFTPQTCMARIYSSFHECLCDILALVEKECVKELGKGQSDADEELLRSRARECSRKLQHFLEKRFKQLSERMEALLTSRCFTIPPNVLLPEDHSHKKYPQDIQKQLDDILEWVREMQAGWAKEGNGNFQESFRLGIESIKKLQSAVKEVLIHSKTLN